MSGQSLSGDFVDHLRQLLQYDPLTGKLYWRERRRGRRAGKPAGCIDTYNGGYLRVMIDGTSYLGHRLIWAIQTGVMPIHTIDHVDGDPANNRWSNLREATRRQNAQNRGLSSTNTSGYPGVTWSHEIKKWRALIGDGGKCRYLGAYDNIQDAAQAYEEAARQAYGEFYRGAEPCSKA